jgi:hypothetical protein
VYARAGKKVPKKSEYAEPLIKNPLVIQVRWTEPHNLKPVREDALLGPPEHVTEAHSRRVAGKLFLGEALGFDQERLNLRVAFDGVNEQLVVGLVAQRVGLPTLLGERSPFAK